MLQSLQSTAGHENTVTSSLTLSTLLFPNETLGML